MEAFVAAPDRMTINLVARVRSLLLQFRRLAPLLSSAAEVLAHGFPLFLQAHRQCYAVGGRGGIRAKEISSLDSVLRRPPLAGLQQFSLR